MGNTRNIALLLLAAAVLAAACVSSPVLAPGDGQILLAANPDTIDLDEFSDPQVLEEETLITAQVLDLNGIPQAGVSVFLSTNGGELVSAPEGQTVVELRTNDSGFVSDTLIVRIGDPETITLTARSGPVSGTLDIDKQEAAENRPPFPSIDITPQGSGITDAPVTFDGSLSDDPDGDTITCYQWEIVTSTDIVPQLPCHQANSRCEIIQGALASQVTRTYAQEQRNINVTLRVTDDPSIACSTTVVEPVENFNASVSEPYSVVCDRSGPTADGGANQVVALGRGTCSMSTGTGCSVDGDCPGTETCNREAVASLDGGNSFDGETGIATYTWNCGNGTASVSGSSVLCTYTRAATFIARLTVTNGCGMSDFDDVVITVED